MTVTSVVKLKTASCAMLALIVTVLISTVFLSLKIVSAAAEKSITNPAKIRPDIVAGVKVKLL
jgi:hypothetical protein